MLYMYDKRDLCLDPHSKLAIEEKVCFAARQTSISHGNESTYRPLSPTAMIPRIDISTTQYSLERVHKSVASTHLLLPSICLYLDLLPRMLLSAYVLRIYCFCASYVMLVEGTLSVRVLLLSTTPDMAETTQRCVYFGRSHPVLGIFCHDVCAGPASLALHCDRHAASSEQNSGLHSVIRWLLHHVYSPDLGLNPADLCSHLP